jgi:hypothetical protein
MEPFSIRMVVFGGRDAQLHDSSKIVQKALWHKYA